MPSTIGGSMRRRCSSVPNTTTGLSPNTFMWTADAPDMPAPDSEIVRIMIAASVMPRPEPPYSSGMQMPSQPASRQRLVEVGGKAALLVLLQPIGVVEARADFRDRVADRFLVGGEREIHLI